MPQEDGTGRIGWLDFAKGFAMALVLIGHSMRDEMRMVSPTLDLLYRALYIFHMTYFFWMAGYTYRLSRRKGRAPLPAAARRLKKQLVPWALYTLAIWGIFSLALRLPGVGSVLRDAGYAALPLHRYLLAALQANNPWAYHLWFLYALMLMTGILALADAAAGGKHLKAVCVGLIALGLAGLALRSVLPLGPWWRLYDYLTLYLPVVCLGILMADLKIPRSLCIVWGLLGLAYIGVRAVFFSGFSGNSLRTDSPALRFVLYLLADLLLPGVMLLLNRLFARFPRTASGRRLLSWLGRESMLIYLIHQPFCCAFLGMLLYGRLGVPAVPTMLICLAVSVGAAWAAAALRDRAKTILQRRIPARD